MTAFSLDKLYFSVAGVPLSSHKSDTISGIQRIAELELDAMELEFVQGVKMTEKTALKVKEASEKYGILLTAHAPYFVNLNAKEPQKLINSHKYIFDTARIISLCGGVSFTYHPGFYLKDKPEDVYSVILKESKKLIDDIKNLNPNLLISPETTGKPSAFGSFDELLSFCQELPDLNLCVDFAHLHARSNGAFNSYKEFCEILNKIKIVKPDLLNHLHIHVSGISYSTKGEIKHLPLKESDFNYIDLLKALIEFNVKGILVCESPILEEDSLLLKKTYLDLKS